MLGADKRKAGLGPQSLESAVQSRQEKEYIMDVIQAMGRSFVPDSAVLTTLGRSRSLASDFPVLWPRTEPVSALLLVAAAGENAMI